MVVLLFCRVFYASFYLVPASAGLRVSVEGSQGHDWAVHSEVLNLCGQRMGIEIIQSSNFVCFNPFFYV